MDEYKHFRQCIDSCPQPLLRAICQLAAGRAELVSVFLKQLGWTGDAMPPLLLALGRPFWLALGSLLELFRWERSGVVAHREVGLPKFSDGFQRLVELSTTGQLPALENYAEDLYRGMLNFWLDNIAWQTDYFLDPVVLLRGNADEQHLDEIAAFMWRNRRELSELARQFPVLGQQPIVDA